MNEFNSKLEVAPPLLKALETEEAPLHRIAIASFNDDGETDYEQIVWSRRLGQDAFEIISPVWITSDFKCGDIISVDNTFTYAEVYPAEWVCNESDLKTLTMIPTENCEPGEIIECLRGVLAESGWICEVVEGRLIVAVLPHEMHQRHADEITAALEAKALIRGPGPWCARYLEAWKAGDETKAVEEFLREEVEEPA